MGVRRAHAKAGRAAPAALARAALAGGTLALSSAGAALAATPANTAITNSASATYSVAGTPITVTGSVTVVTTASTPATIEFKTYVAGGAGLPDGTATRQNVPVTSCNAGAGFTPLPPPKPPGQQALTVPGSQLLAGARFYASGDVVFVQVKDHDQNANPQVTETIEVTVSSSNGDSELLRLTETGPSTGVFVGYVPTTFGAAQPGNCVLNIGSNQKLLATYTDQSDKGVAITAAALVDPLGLVFDSSTGKPIDGVEVTLINMATGLPATVVGNDGVSSYPSTVITGSTVVDVGGTRYALGSGRYQFPRVAPGNYRLSVAAPVGHAFPSTVETAALQALATGPFAIAAGSRGEAFQLLNGPPATIDLPLDPADAASVNITKTAAKAVAAIGEFVPYTLTIRNGSKSAVANLRIADRLPQGFRYQAGSARLNGVALADPSISADGRGLEFRVGSLPGSDSPGLTLRYVAAVLAGTPVGTAENTAQAVGGLKSNIARASVLVRDDLNRERAILMGRVTLVASCRDDESDEKTAAPIGLKDVRVMLHDGTYIVTDNEGRWHADNLRPGTHVVQIDETSMPQDFEYQACEQNTRTGGRNFSQFVNVRGGSLWRADFRYAKVASCLRQNIQVQGKSVRLALDAPVANQSLSATVMLPGAKVVADSVMLDGKPFPQAEGGDGYLVLRLGRHLTRWKHVLSFELDTAPSNDLTVAVQLHAHQRPAQQLQPLTLKAPASQVEQCAPIALPDTHAAVAALNPAPSASTDDQVGGARLQLIEQLPYDDKWIAAAEPGTEWLHPQASFMPALPVVKVAVKHAPQDSLEIKVNGGPVGALRYDGMITNPAGTLALSSWRSVELRNGANLMEVTVRDPQGQVVMQESREIHYVVGPAKGVLDISRSTLVADGRFPPVIAVRMLDKDGKPVRRGATGEVQIAAPYQSLDQAQALQRDPLTGNLGGKPRYEIGDDGVALIKLQPTTQAGEVVLNFDFGNDRKQELRVWLAPDLREWVLVGFAEGTLGHKRLSGNMEALSANRADDQLFDRNRLAFYAKGQIKGEYLLTLAYDSAKEKNSAGTLVLKQAINPTQYYTLYADATQAQFDAASASKLYLKIEKSQFYAMFGDYDTGLTLTELGRYSRTLNGAKAEYKGERVGYNVFASMTTQSFRKDEIQGQGISGLYRLSSGNVVVNTDKVRIETRDRLRPEVVLKTQEFTRYLDYQIDHAGGTLFFREPIPALDTAMNPVFIVVEFETDTQAGAKLTYGGRATMKVSENSTLGLTRVHEGNVGREATLTAIDASVLLNDTTKLRAEVAQSQRNALEGPSSGSAYLVEMAHYDKTVGARAYARQQDLGFGLGQQSSFATGTRKIGVDGQAKLSESTQVQATAYREEKETIDAHAERNVAEARVQWSQYDLSTHLGARLAKEADSAKPDNNVRQIIGGASYQMLDKQLTLRAVTEMDVGDQGGGSVAFPNRVTLGADYRLTAQTTLLAAREMAWADPLKVNVTRVGLRTQPWTGSELAATLGNQAGLDSGRLYSDIGLVQKLQLDAHWAADFGLSRVQTLRGVAPETLSLLPSSAATATAGNDSAGDFTAVHAGAAYKDKEWSGNGRIERRNGSTTNKVNLLLGAQRQLAEGRAMAAGLIYNLVEGDTGSRRLDLRLSYADRPLNAEWVWLDRLEYIHESQQTADSRLLARKLINNFNANWQPNRRSQVALQYSAKYVLDTIDQAAYRGFTDLTGIEARRDLTAWWDVGLHASVLHSWKNGSRQYHRGVSTAFMLADNVWLALGYNQRGFTDPDFIGAPYRAKGVYVSLRFKFDQDTLDLNDRRKAPFSFKLK